MPRIFTPLNLIQLPVLSAAEAAVLVTELLATADRERPSQEGKLYPPAVERSLLRLVAAYEALNKALLPRVSGGDPSRKRMADRAVDTAWSGTFDWLSGWAKLPDERTPLAAPARHLLALIFPEGLNFTRLPYKVEWQESKVRLEVIERDGHDKTFEALGGLVFLEHLRATHAIYGEVLGITHPQVSEEQIRDLGEKRTALLDALRDYTSRATNLADPDEPGSERLSMALLQPLTDWETTRTTQEPEPMPTPAPVPG